MDDPDDDGMETVEPTRPVLIEEITSTCRRYYLPGGYHPAATITTKDPR